MKSISIRQAVSGLINTFELAFYKVYSKPLHITLPLSGRRMEAKACVKNEY
jgi:hypothetical protein